MAIEAFAPAKINLALHVTGQRDDGYHLLDSLVVFADLGDTVTLEPADRLSLTVTGPQAAGVPADSGNLVLRAAALAGLTGGAFTLVKNLPAAAGLGGGSSDAAAALRAISALTGQPPPQNALSLGADLPVCLAGRAARMQGLGEVLTLVPGLPHLPAVLVNPGVALPTPAVFGQLRAKTNPPMPETIPRGDGVAALARWLGAQRNDLEAPARSLQPVIGEVLAALAPNSLLARMSGSGATCFALYEDTASAAAAAARIAAARPGWWVQSCILNP